MQPSRVFVHDFNILTPGEAAHWVRGLAPGPGLAIISPRSDVSSDVSPGRRVFHSGHSHIREAILGEWIVRKSYVDGHVYF